MHAHARQTETGPDLPPVPLTPNEPIAFDADMLEAFCRRQGAAAEEAIGAVLLEIEERLVLAAWQGDRGEYRGLRRSAGLLAELGARIGMLTLIRAANAVADCIDRGDEAALPACAARLTRLADRSRLAEWRLDTDAGA